MQKHCLHVTKCGMQKYMHVAVRIIAANVEFVWMDGVAAHWAHQSSATYSTIVASGLFVGRSQLSFAQFYTLVGAINQSQFLYQRATYCIRILCIRDSTFKRLDHHVVHQKNKKYSFNLEYTFGLAMPKILKSKRTVIEI